MVAVGSMLVPASFRVDIHGSIYHSPRHPFLYYTGPTSIMSFMCLVSVGP